MRVARRLGLTSSPDDAAVRRRVREVSKRCFALVYSNMVTNGRLVSRLMDLGCPVLTHVHEVELSIQGAGGENFRLVKSQTARYLVGANAVKSNLIVRHRVERDRIDVVHGFVETRDADTAVSAHAGARTQSELGIRDGAHVVGAAGSANWAKSPDLFVPLALSAK